MFVATVLRIFEELINYVIQVEIVFRNRIIIVC